MVRYLLTTGTVPPSMELYPYSTVFLGVLCVLASNLLDLCCPPSPAICSFRCKVGGDPDTLTYSAISLVLHQKSRCSFLKDSTHFSGPGCDWRCAATRQQYLRRVSVLQDIVNKKVKAPSVMDSISISHQP